MYIIGIQVNEYESGKAIPNQQVLGKLERALGIKLRGKNIGEPLTFGKKKQREAFLEKHLDIYTMLSSVVKKKGDFSSQVVWIQDIESFIPYFFPGSLYLYKILDKKKCNVHGR